MLCSLLFVAPILNWNYSPATIEGMTTKQFGDALYDFWCFGDRLEISWSSRAVQRDHWVAGTDVGHGNRLVSGVLRQN